MRAALTLFDEQGFDATTTTAIAAQAGLTERTYFRHFPDKREVLFAGSEGIRDVAVPAIDEALVTSPPFEAVLTGLTAAGAVFVEDREFHRRRQRVIASNAALQEREWAKLATLSAAIAAALRRGGVREPAATLLAGVGITVFEVAYGKWIAEPDDHDFAACMARSEAELGAALDTRTQGTSQT
jgi:AcrR family transcriptional regulator